MTNQKKTSVFHSIIGWVKKHPFICIGSTAVIVLLGISSCVISALSELASYSPPVTEYQDVADYGKFDGTDNEEFVNGYIQSFFPKAIDDTFSNVTYSYNAVSGPTYCFEAYLEFTIEDPDEFDLYISSIADENQWQKFEYDSSFMEYNIENELIVGDSSEINPESPYHIIKSKIRKILYCPETQTVIYVALGLYDGSINVKYLDTFFKRFDINPAVYEQTAELSDLGPYDI